MSTEVEVLVKKWRDKADDPHACGIEGMTVYRECADQLEDALAADQPVPDEVVETVREIDVQYVETANDHTREAWDHPGVMVVTGLPWRAECEGLKVAATTEVGVRQLIERMLSGRDARPALPPSDGLADRLAELHVRIDQGHAPGRCGECNQFWPCTTIALVAAPGAEGDAT